MSEYGPTFQHHCETCLYLGTYGAHDLYFCPQGALPTVIARFGSEGPEYCSGLASAQAQSLRELETVKADPSFWALRVAYLIARDAGLLAE